MFKIFFFVILGSVQTFARTTPAPTPQTQNQSEAPALSLFQQLNGGWPEEIESQLKDQSNTALISAQKNYVFIFAYAPKEPIDLRSGELLHQSVQNKLLSKSDGGHMMFGWQCQNLTNPQIQNSPFKGMAAITGESSSQAVNLLQNGWGLNSYLATFTDGVLQTPAILKNVIQNRVITDRANFSFVLQEVSHQECMNGLIYLNKFQQKPVTMSPPRYRFGSIPDPTDANEPGAGCLSFGYHFMKSVGLFQNVHPFLLRDLIVPERLLGYGQVNDQQQPVMRNRDNNNLVAIADVQIQQRLTPQSRRSIGYHYLMNSDWNPWGNESTLKVPQVDPELVYLFFRELSQEVAKTLTQSGLSLSNNPQVDQEIQRKIRHRREIIGLDYKAPSEDFRRTYMVEPGYDHGFVDTNDGRFQNSQYRGNSEAISMESKKWVQENSSQTKMSLIPLFHGYGIILLKN